VKGDKKKEDIYINNVYKELKLYSLWLYIRIKKERVFKSNRKGNHRNRFWISNTLTEFIFIFFNFILFLLFIIPCLLFITLLLSRLRGV